MCQRPGEFRKFDSPLGAFLICKTPYQILLRPSTPPPPHKAIQDTKYVILILSLYEWSGVIDAIWVIVSHTINAPHIRENGVGWETIHM